MSRSRPSTADKRRTFRKLHEADCFVIPNPWSVGSARYLQGLGFKALATTSSGHAHSEGLPNGGQTIDDVLAHYAELAAATDVPLNADFENGFADDPDEVAANVTRCIATGVAGLSVEDSPNSDYSALRFRSCAQARQSCACRDRQGGR
jgi:2-methylisocitrate lyase-like PEP mutase family enzyme